MIAHAMADMTNTICGHDRDVLRWALELWATVTNGGMVVYSAGTGGAKVAKANAFGDANDPAKLTAIIAELLRERGLSVKTDPQYDCQWLVFADEYDAVSIVAPRFAKAITMPQARAFALALLDVPNATAQDIERMIGEAVR